MCDSSNWRAKLHPAALCFLVLRTKGQIDAALRRKTKKWEKYKITHPRRNKFSRVNQYLLVIPNKARLGRQQQREEESSRRQSSSSSRSERQVKGGVHSTSTVLHLLIPLHRVDNHWKHSSPPSTGVQLQEQPQSEEKNQSQKSIGPRHHSLIRIFRRIATYPSASHITQYPRATDEQI